MVEAIKQFFQWWRGELKSIFSVRGAKLALDLNDVEITLLKSTRERWKIIGAVSHDSPEWAEEMQNLVEIAKNRMPFMHRLLGVKLPQVQLFLPTEQTLSTEEIFPPEAAYNLNEAASWRINSLTPYQQDELAYDCIPLSRDDSGNLKSLIAVTPRTTIQEAIEYAQKWGFSPQIVSTRIKSHNLHHGRNSGPFFAHILPAEYARQRPFRMISAVCAILLLLTGAFGTWYSAHQKITLADSLDEKRQHLVAQISDAKKQKAQSTHFIAAASAPHKRREREPYVLDVLEQLAEALPDSVYTTKITIQNGIINIEGVATQAQDALKAIDSSRSFNLARFTAPVTPLRGDKYGENFVIEAEVATYQGSAQ